MARLIGYSYFDPNCFIHYAFFCARGFIHTLLYESFFIHPELQFYLNFWKTNWKLKRFAIFIKKNLVMLRKFMSLHILIITLISSLSNINASPYHTRWSRFLQVVACSTYVKLQMDSFLRLEMSFSEFKGINVYR